MTVILNALRALRTAPEVGRLDIEASALARRFGEEHASILAVAERLREVADGLGTLDTATSLAQARQVHRMLVDKVVPHEEAEDRQLYPLLDRAIGGTNPTGPMSREHTEIAHQVRRLGELLGEIGAEGSDEEDVIELRRLLYGLHAILRLHTTQEDESYLSLGDQGSESDERSPGR